MTELNNERDHAVRASSIASADDADYAAPFRAAESAMRRMEAKYVSGEWSLEEYAVGLGKVIVRDTSGGEWTIGATSGEWYRREAGSQWVRTEPPTD